VYRRIRQPAPDPAKPVPSGGEAAKPVASGGEAAKPVAGDQAAKPVAGDQAAKPVAGDQAAKPVAEDQAAKPLPSTPSPAIVQPTPPPHIDPAKLQPPKPDPVIPPPRVTSPPSAPSPRLHIEPKPALSATVDVAVDSVPAGAQVMRGSTVLGNTPFHGTLPRRDSDVTLVIRLAGYADRSVVVHADHAVSEHIKLVRSASAPTRKPNRDQSVNPFGN
jgi:hypothetical protein